MSPAGLRFLLDTNALSEPTKTPQVQHPGVIRRLRMYRGQIAIASTTWHEALFGLYRLPEGQRKQAIHDYLFGLVAPSIPILIYGRRAAEWHARERARLGGMGNVPTFADSQIAAVAKIHGLTVVTENVSDFERFEGLSIENWRTP